MRGTNDGERTQARELVTLHRPMSAYTFNRLLDLLAREWPDSIPIPDRENPFIVRVMSREPRNDEQDEESEAAGSHRGAHLRRGRQGPGPRPIGGLGTPA